MEFPYQWMTDSAPWIIYGSIVGVALITARQVGKRFVWPLIRTLVRSLFGRDPE